MILEWNLRDEIFAVAHRWWLPLLAFLIGSLVGWGTSVVIPPVHRAEVRFSVAYNADSIFRNPDDYKNWQLEQLNALAIAPDVLQETLQRLQAQDPYWQTISADRLQSMLDVSYRNTGTWRLTVQNQNANRAAQAAQAWADVLLKNYQQAFSDAETLLQMDSQLQTMASTLIQTNLRVEDLLSTSQGIQDWRENLAQKPGDQPLDELTRWQLWSLAARAAGFDPAWTGLLQEFPSEQASAQEYLPWVDRLVASTQQELESKQSQAAAMQKARDDLKKQYGNLVQISRGLSAKLVVEQTSKKPVTTSLRPTGLLALIGGVLGLLAWALGWLVHLNYKKPGKGVQKPANE